MPTIRYIRKFLLSACKRVEMGRNFTTDGLCFLTQVIKVEMTSRIESNWLNDYDVNNPDGGGDGNNINDNNYDDDETNNTNNFVNSVFL